MPLGHPQSHEGRGGQRPEPKPTPPVRCARTVPHATPWEQRLSTDRARGQRPFVSSTRADGLCWIELRPWPRCRAGTLQAVLELSYPARPGTSLHNVNLITGLHLTEAENDEARPPGGTAPRGGPSQAAGQCRPRAWCVRRGFRPRAALCALSASCPHFKGDRVGRWDPQPGISGRPVGPTRTQGIVSRAGLRLPGPASFLGTGLRLGAEPHEAPPRRAAP